MPFFIGLALPPNFARKVLKFQRKYENNSLPEIVEPHITVKAQGGLSEGMDWLSPVRNVIEGTIPFEVKVGKPNTFAGKVVYLSVQSDGAKSLHRELVKAVSPSEDEIAAYYEMDSYVPHVSIAIIDEQLGSDTFERIREDASKTFTGSFSFMVESARIYGLTDRGTYVTLGDISFQKSS